eukprot:CAMPEP_0183506272 /NCGR_PEP_ID=MMETSP0371-20130417/7307_1 /TAXON_ID=268820 /ORGANISM="Peridinium aciculiferum, Strain PAER-2" /LENGTH=30 /DNA_ID= /DNA_START= /DNA_END= /DNA_ORIENTATION=
MPTRSKVALEASAPLLDCEYCLLTVENINT